MNVSDQQIDVWEVSPSLDDEADFEIFDCYHAAIEYAKDVLESVFEGLATGDEIAIVIRLTTMTRDKFNRRS